MSCPIPVHDDVKHAMDKLQSLHDGDIAVVLDAISCGARAIPPLRTLLFAREPSGLFEVRCRAVEVLARLDAYDVLAARFIQI